jgi:hypothetical protein
VLVSLKFVCLGVKEKVAKGLHWQWNSLFCDIWPGPRASVEFRFAWRPCLIWKNSRSTRSSLQGIEILGPIVWKARFAMHNKHLFTTKEDSERCNVRQDRPSLPMMCHKFLSFPSADVRQSSYQSLLRCKKLLTGNDLSRCRSTAGRWK